MLNLKEVVQRTIANDVLEGTVTLDLDGNTETFLYRKVPAQDLFAKTVNEEKDKIQNLSRALIDPDTNKPYPDEVMSELIKKAPLLMSRIYDVILAESYKYHMDLDAQISQKKVLPIVQKDSST